MEGSEINDRRQTAVAKAKASRGKNVLGGPLESCSEDPLTGYTRSGCCEAVQGDFGMHIVCVRMTEEFLEFSQEAGNDLSTPIPEYGFPGLKPGDQWCLCAARWKEALEAGAAPQVVLEATHMSTLEFVSLEELQDHAFKRSKG
jgi:uncharacterized protein (DUF2237 family)